jgi:hypothetical protein
VSENSWGSSSPSPTFFLVQTSTIDGDEPRQESHTKQFSTKEKMQTYRIQGQSAKLVN